MSLLGNSQTTPLLHSLQVTQSLNGIVIPILFGTNRVPLNLLWTGDFTNGQPYQAGGKGLGKSGNAYEYFAAILGALSQGTIVNVLNVYSQNGRLNLNATTEQFTVPPGGGSYTVANAPVFATDAGVGAAVPYTVAADNYGAPAPVIYSGIYQVPHKGVPVSPGVNEYTVTGGTYIFPASSAGQTVTIAYTFSLYVLGSTEDFTVPNTSPYEVTVQFAPEWRTNEGVFYVLTGQALTEVGGSPGPGQYSTSNGNYFFNAADANAAVAIAYTWRQSNSNVDPNSMLNFTLIEGGQGQSPWTYLTSFHASQALGYSTIACIGAEKMDLGESATLPNYNFECQSALTFGAGILDAKVSDCILALLFDPHFGVAFQGAVDGSLQAVSEDYWTSNNFFISPVLNSSETCASIIEKWCGAGNVGVYWSEGLLKFVPYGDTTTIANGAVYTPQTHPVFDLNDDDFIAPDNEDPVSIERTPFQDAYNSVKVQFTNRINAYNDDIVQETDDYSIELYGLRPEGQQDFDFLCTASAATFAANIRLKRLVYIRGKYHFTVSSLRYGSLEPMDLVTLTDFDLGLNKTPVRIIETTESQDYTLEIVAEEFPWGTATATIYQKQPALPPPPPPALADPGDTKVVSIFEPSSRVATTLANSAFQQWIAMNGGPNWGGAEVWLSLDGLAYQSIGVQYGVSRCGVITANLPAGSDPDLTDTCSVAISGQLFNVSVQQADGLSTLCKIGDEYISYANATLTGNDGQGTNFYDLTYLRRGAFTSPNIAHIATDPFENQFIRLDSQIFQYSFDPSLAGKTVYLKFTSFNLLQNQQQALSDVVAYPVVIGGINLSANMMVDSVLDIGGATASVRIYQVGQAPGTAGSATLTNGAVIVLPADTQTGEALATTYYVNFDPATSTYVFYTDQNAWLLDEITNGFLRIGFTMTPTDFGIIPLLGGGSLAIGAGSDNILLPTGYNYSDMVVALTPKTGFDSTQQIDGVGGTSQSSGVTSSNFHQRSGGSTTSTTNWVAACFSTGAAVTVTTVGAFTYINATTANGDDICVVQGNQNGGSIPIPAGFSASEFIWFAGMSSVVSSGHGMQGVQACSIDSFMNVTSLYNDNAGNSWGGNASILGFFWKPGGTIATSGVTGGIAVIIPTLGGHFVSLIQANLGDTGSFSLPAGFSTVVAAAGMASFTPNATHVSHGWNAIIAGLTCTSNYSDGGGPYTVGHCNIFGVSTI